MNLLSEASGVERVEVPADGHLAHVKFDGQFSDSNRSVASELPENDLASVAGEGSAARVVRRNRAGVASSGGLGHRAQHVSAVMGSQQNRTILSRMRTYIRRDSGGSGVLTQVTGRGLAHSLVPNGCERLT